MTTPDEIGARLVLRDRPAFSRDADQARRSIESIGDAAPRAEAKSRGPLAAISGGVMGVARTAARAGAYIGAGLAAGGAAAIGLGIKTAAGMETAQISFTTMLGSAEKAQTFLAELSAFSAKTPFDLPGLQSAASSLVSAGVDANKVIPIMTSLGNATSGMGTGAEGVQRATVALQQMSAAGRITGEDLNQLRDAGIPVFDLLAAATGKSVKEVAALAQEGKLGAKELEQLMGALESGEGLERFNGLMEAQSASMSGLWSTLKDTFSVGMAEAIQPLVPIIKEGLGGAIDLVGRGMPYVKDGLADIVNWATLLYNVFAKGDFKGDIAAKLGIDESDKIVDTLFDIREGSVGIMDAFKSDGASGSLSSIKDSLVALAPAAGEFAESLPAISTSLGVADAVLGFFAANVDTLIKFMPLIVAGFVAFKAAQAAANVVAAASIPLRIAEVIANRALVKALREVAVTQGIQTAAATVNTGATAVNTGATNANMLTRVRLRAVSIASAAATGVMTAAQWLLNAAMTANPIGLVIIGLVALGVAFFMLWKKSETFRNIVTGAFNAVKGAAATAFEWIKSNWPLILAVITGPFGLAVLAVSRNMDTIKTAVRGAINYLIRAWNGLSFSLPSVDSKIPGVGRVGGMTISTPDIPTLHTGGTVTAGGVVNMKPDEELIVLPPAASVIPLPSGSGPVDLSAAGTGGPLVVQLVADGKVLAETVIDHVQAKVARA